MANPQRGEVPLTVGDRLFTMAFTFDASCQLEAACSTSDEYVTAHKAFRLALTGSHTHCRALLWAVLREYHAEITLKQAGELIKDMGGVEQFFAAILELDKASRPDEEDLKGRPPAARQPSTGEPTTSTPGASASRKKVSGA